MRIQLIRSARARVIGVLLSFRERDGAIGIVTVPHADYEYWRLCESCHLAEAAVWCRTHGKFYCSVCLHFHSVAGECDLMSRAAARELAQLNLCG